MLRKRYVVNGQVQGVGFRPFVYRLAHEVGLTGTVRNTPEGVVIEVQGADAALDQFRHGLSSKLPPLARIVDLRSEDADAVEDEHCFTILSSTSGRDHVVLISPEVATCDDCMADIFDPDNRRHLYAFTNCTNCGPRYTITRSLPYDRPMTSMACFDLCPACREEYENPLDRRFHAQPNACPVCGPAAWITDAQGEEIEHGVNALRQAARLLAQGRILAVKGLGGFHLSCDAANENAVNELRRRKQRWGKPLAVMAPDLDTVRAIAHLFEAEERILTGPERPITLLERTDDCPLAQNIAPDTSQIGVMLPYTPLHHVLLHFFRDETAHTPALVMTSGNISGEPICLGNREALSKLSDVADFFLFHNRDILIRTDDSVLRVVPRSGRTQFLRRARGFTPTPIFLAGKGPSVLATGPELKNTLCVTRQDNAFVSQHIGDLDNLETFDFFREIREHMVDILRVSPTALIHDLHPDYMTTRYALEQEDLPTLAVQHHFAHIHAVLAENRFEGPALGLALDGTGFGEDGTLWGGEALFVDNSRLRHERLGHLATVMLPGGDAAAREPWRMARSYLHAIGIKNQGRRPWPWLEEYRQADAMVGQMLDKKVNAPLTSSCGRLFDAVAGLLGIALTIDYEAQAAILLEEIQNRNETGAYPCPVLSDLSPVLLDTLTLFRHVYADFVAGVPSGVISRRFHLGLISGLADMAVSLSSRTGVTEIALSGGVMLNLTLNHILPAALKARGLRPMLHEHLPPGDACISLGQAAWGRRAVELGHDFGRNG